MVRPKDTVEVAILPYKDTGKYSFVNLTKGHICPCKFNGFVEALRDMDNAIKLGYVIEYKEIR